MADQNRAGLGRVIVGLVLFGIAFGYVEAAVVVYLRAVYQPVREQMNPEHVSSELFPLIRLDQLESLGADHLRQLQTELGREFATLVLLAGAALLAAGSFNEWIASFVIAFGIWDIFYYLFLKLLIDWPASLFTWDVLFLLPVPWAGPVITPVLVSVAMMVAGLLVLWREYDGRPVAFTHWHWAAIVSGGLLIVISFAWDYRNIMAGRHPAPFNWPLYFGGLLLGAGAFVHAFARRLPGPARPTPATQQRTPEP
jgi:hypothetical protein